MGLVNNSFYLTFTNILFLKYDYIKVLWPIIIIQMVQKFIIIIPEAGAEPGFKFRGAPNYMFEIIHFANYVTMYF